MHVLAANVRQAVLGFVLQPKETTERLGRIRAAGIDQLEELDGLAMVLATRSATKGSAAGGVRRRDARQDRERVATLP